ncbi:gpW family head-tail joining protein [Caballeronia sordidicola]|uniref:GpW protein n=1 Tax=Caballeronia sordidicola TaxID=196367 RepID=A0A242N7A6_CABSO|nr:gpW family head-tail joining protein [Caballeronia sordidicola]OTP79482.1 hypothetical protein PAMC26577_01045 [Caballeronia sordidicola]
MATSDINSPLYGMTDAQLQALLAQAQNAYAQLRTGTNVVTIAYAQGDGSRSATYQQTDMASLRIWISELIAALNPGVVVGRRRRMVPLF